MSSRVYESGNRTFQGLPIEVNENIASFLDTDRDFANFNAICRETRSAIQSHRCGAWRAQWRQEYDLPSEMTGLQIKAEYQRRRMCLYTKAFNMGKETAEANCIAVLKQLVIESFAGSAKEQSNNVIRLHRFLKESNIIRTFNKCIDMSEKQCTPDLQALHVCLAHWYLECLRLGEVPLYCFPMSQVVAYSKPMDFPIFLNDGDLTAAKVNMPTVLHMINFWRYHMKDWFCRTLDVKHKPKGWRRPISDRYQGLRGLSRHWKGSYAFMSHPRDVVRLRNYLVDSSHEPMGTMMHFDKLDECGGLENVEFDFEEAHNITVWPNVFEEHLEALPSASLCNYIRVARHRLKEAKGKKAAKQRGQSDTPASRTQHVSRHGHLPLSPPSSTAPAIATQGPRTLSETIPSVPPQPPGPQKGKDYLPFNGSVESDDSTSADQGISGILHSLPDQSGIPGFQRISFMKYAINTPDPEDGLGNARPENYYDQFDETYYCYQGVVLPGGHIILGRWWAPFDDEEQYCTGPFMLWAVEE